MMWLVLKKSLKLLKIYLLGSYQFGQKNKVSMGHAQNQVDLFFWEQQ